MRPQRANCDIAQVDLRQLTIGSDKSSVAIRRKIHVPEIQD
jgi:hypothetical protein